jgi:hypothetical protein
MPVISAAEILVMGTRHRSLPIRDISGALPDHRDLVEAEAGRDAPWAVAEGLVEGVERRGQRSRGLEQLEAVATHEQVADHPEAQRGLLAAPAQDAAVAFELSAQRARGDVALVRADPAVVHPARAEAREHARLGDGLVQEQKPARAHGAARAFERRTPVGEVVQDAEDQDHVRDAFAERPVHGVALHGCDAGPEDAPAGLQRGQRDVRGDVAQAGRRGRPQPGDRPARARAHLDRQRARRHSRAHVAEQVQLARAPAQPGSRTERLQRVLLMPRVPPLELVLDPTDVLLAGAAVGRGRRLAQVGEPVGQQDEHPAVHAEGAAAVGAADAFALVDERTAVLRADGRLQQRFLYDLHGRGL